MTTALKVATQTKTAKRRAKPNAKPCAKQRSTLDIAAIQPDQRSIPELAAAMARLYEAENDAGLFTPEGQAAGERLDACREEMFAEAPLETLRDAAYLLAVLSIHLYQESEEERPGADIHKVAIYRLHRWAERHAGERVALRTDGWFEPGETDLQMIHERTGGDVRTPAAAEPERTVTDYEPAWLGCGELGGNHALHLAHVLTVKPRQMQEIAQAYRQAMDAKETAERRSIDAKKAGRHAEADQQYRLFRAYEEATFLYEIEAAYSGIVDDRVDAAAALLFARGCTSHTLSACYADVARALQTKALQWLEHDNGAPFSRIFGNWMSTHENADEECLTPPDPNDREAMDRWSRNAADERDRIYEMARQG